MTSMGSDYRRSRAIATDVIAVIPVRRAATQNVSQTYTLTLVRGDRRTGTATPITNATSDASRQLGYTDGVQANRANFLQTFPYLNTPIAG